MTRAGSCADVLPTSAFSLIALVTFAILLVPPGVRATPGVLVLPLERESGWSRPVFRPRSPARTVRTMLGGYQVVFWTAGLLCVVAGMSFLTIGRSLRAATVPVVATAG